MSEKTCSSCAHWRASTGVYEPKVIPRDPIDNEDYIGRGRCGAIPHTMPDWDRDETGVAFPADPVAFVEDGSGYYSALITRGDFGCVLHRPKA